jgi:hypothetical protein
MVVSIMNAMRIVCPYFIGVRGSVFYLSFSLSVGRVGFRMTHAKPIQTSITFAWVIG